jgi:membrane-associated phospholipid phosphatase
MSIDASIDARLRRRRLLASLAFVVLLLLSILWPAPVVELNALTLHEPIAVDDLSFLGREQPAWDVIYWCLAGLFALALLHPSVAEGSFTLAVVREEAVAVPRRLAARWRELRFWATAAALAAAAAIVAAIWWYLDAPVTAWAEWVQSDDMQSLIRLANRFGGGGNPPMIVFFFLLAGVACLERRWIRYAYAMAIGGLGAGIAVQIVKYLVGRTRPELWLGPFHHARAAASSFPSGHTVGAFAIAGVLIFGARNAGLRVSSALLALAVAVSRILAFRHWTSDVTASAIIGLAVSWFVVTALVRETEYAGTGLAHESPASAGPEPSQG